jgi:hypothetical protein
VHTFAGRLAAHNMLLVYHAEFCCCCRWQESVGVLDLSTSYDVSCILYIKTRLGFGFCVLNCVLVCCAFGSGVG